LYSNDDVYNEILKPDFIKTYLPQLAETLQVDFDLPVSLDKIDAKDFGAPIVTPLIFKPREPAPFHLLTFHGHGELQTQPVKSEESGIINLVAKHRPCYSDNIPCLRGLRLIGLDDAGIEEGSWIIGNNINWPDMYWFSDILSKSKCEKLLIAIKSKSGIVNDIVAKMFMRIADQQPDERIKIDLYCSMIQSLSNPILINKSIKVASMGIARENFNVQRSALRLFRALFENKHGFPEAIVAASASIASENLDVQNAALELFMALVKEKQGFPEAIQAASAGIASKNLDVQNSAIELFKALVENSHLRSESIFSEAISAAIVAASAGIASENWHVQNAALELFMALVKKRQGFPEAKAAASAGISSKNLDVQNSTLELFKALVENGQGIPEAIKAASTGIASEDINVCLLALKLFKALFTANHGFPEAIQAANAGIASKIYIEQQLALELFKALFESGYWLTEAKAFIEVGLKGKDKNIKESARLLNDLVQEHEAKVAK
jgi:hypothetical protein